MQNLCCLNLTSGSWWKCYIKVLTYCCSKRHSMSFWLINWKVSEGITFVLMAITSTMYRTIRSADNLTIMVEVSVLNGQKYRFAVHPKWMFVIFCIRIFWWIKHGKQNCPSALTAKILFHSATVFPEIMRELTCILIFIPNYSVYCMIYMI